MTSVMPTETMTIVRHLRQVDVQCLQTGEIRRDREIEREQHDEPASAA
jgi:hypothetical protein